MRQNVRFLCRILLAAGLLWLCRVPVWGNESGGKASSTQERLFQELDLTQVQELLDSMVPEKSFSVSDAVKKIMAGETVLSKETLQEYLRGLFFSEYLQMKDMILKILILVIAGAVFLNFSSVFLNAQISEVGFYAAYMMLFVLLVNLFQYLSKDLADTLEWMTEFMKSLTPSYLIAVTAASGVSSAAVFYEGVILLVWMIQWVLLSVLLPAANLYVLLELVNHLSREEMLGKMAELAETVTGWGLKTMLGMVVGLQVVKNLVAPILDTLRRSVIGKTAGAIPGIGNAMNMVTELVLSGAVLVRNSLGTAVLLALVLAGARPVLKYAGMSLVFRLLAALCQPISDRRMVRALGTMGEGCSVLMRILLTAQVLGMLIFVILMVSFGGG